MWAPVVNNVVAIAGHGSCSSRCTAAGDHPAGVVDAGGDRGARRHDHARRRRPGAHAGAGAAPDRLPLAPAPRLPRASGCARPAQVAGWTFGGAARRPARPRRRCPQVANRAGQEAGAAATGRFVYDTAFLLFMLPHSLVTVSVVTAVFTRMSRGRRRRRASTTCAATSRSRCGPTGVATVLATVAFAVLGPGPDRRCSSRRTPARRPKASPGRRPR